MNRKLTFVYDEESGAYLVTSRNDSAGLAERCTDSMSLISRIVEDEGSGPLQVAWEVFQKEMKEDVCNAEEKMKNLENQLRLRNDIIEDNINAFEELRRHCENEKMIVLQQEKERCKNLVLDFKQCLEIRDKQLQEATDAKNELMDRLNSLFRKKTTIKNKKAILVKQIEDLTNEVEAQSNVIDTLKKALNDSHNQREEEQRRKFSEGYELGRKVAYIEEMGILQELEILKSIEATLENDQLEQTKNNS